MINKLEFIHFFTAACIVEMIMLYLFRFTRSPLTGKAINNWYTNLGWSAVILDILSVLIGFYIAKFIYEYLLKNKFITKEYSLVKFLAIVLMVQITHDFSFYYLIINHTIDSFSQKRIKSYRILKMSFCQFKLTQFFQYN